MDLGWLERPQDVGSGVSILVEPWAEGTKSASEAPDVGAGQGLELILEEWVVGVADRPALQVGDEGAGAGNSDVAQGRLLPGKTMEAA